MLVGAAAEVPTGGASTVLVVFAWFSFATSGVQCINGIYRSAEAISDPQSNSLQELDNNTIYSTANFLVDAIGVVTSVVSLRPAMRNLFAILERRGGMAITVQQLRNLPRPERAEAIRRALQQATRTPEGRAEVQRALVNSGLSPRQVAQAMEHGATTTRRSRVITNGLSRVTARRLNATVLDILGGVGGIGLSATPPSWTGSGSGSVHSLIIHVVGIGGD